MKTAKTIYWIATVLMCAVFAFSAGMYLTQYDVVKGFFTALGFPTWLVLPLAVAKILGVVAVLTRKSAWLTEWAYAGFFFDAAIATAAHYFAGHGLLGLSLLALIATVVSRALLARRSELLEATL